jgi:hypothetical protein
MPEGDHRWRTREEVVAAGGRAGLRERSFDRTMLVPKDVPVLRGLDTVAWATPLRQRLGLIQRLVLEPARAPGEAQAGGTT